MTVTARRGIASNQKTKPPGSIAFAPGRSSPGTPEGDALLAHVQQQRGGSTAGHGSDGAAGAEHDADRAAAAAVQRIHTGAGDSPPSFSSSRAPSQVLPGHQCASHRVLQRTHMSQVAEYVADGVALSRRQRRDSLIELRAAIAHHRCCVEIWPVVVLPHPAAPDAFAYAVHP